MLTHFKRAAHLMLVRLRGCFQGGGAAHSCGVATTAFLAGEMYLVQNTSLQALDIGEYLNPYSCLEQCAPSEVHRPRSAIESRKLHSFSIEYVL